MFRGTYGLIESVTWFIEMVVKLPIGSMIGYEISLSIDSIRFANQYIEA